MRFRRNRVNVGKEQDLKATAVTGRKNRNVFKINSI